MMAALDAPALAGLAASFNERAAAAAVAATIVVSILMASVYTRRRPRPSCGRLNRRGRRGRAR